MNWQPESKGNQSTNQREIGHVSSCNYEMSGDLSSHFVHI